MANTYSWEIDDLIVDPLESGLTNVVKKVHTYLVADDGAGHTVRQLLVATLPAPDPGTFIPFADLTLVVVVGWCETAFGTPSIDAWKAVLDARLTETAYEAMPCPWE